MAGAGSLAMMNYLYNRAPRDGTVMGVPLNGVVLEPTLKLLSRNGGSANFDIDKMSWVGSTTQDAQVLWFRSDSGIATIDDLQVHPEHRRGERAWRRQFHRHGPHQPAARRPDGPGARLSGHQRHLPGGRARRGARQRHRLFGDRQRPPAMAGGGPDPAADPIRHRAAARAAGRADRARGGARRRDPADAAVLRREVQDHLSVRAAAGGPAGAGRRAAIGFRRHHAGSGLRRRT